MISKKDLDKHQVTVARLAAKQRLLIEEDLQQLRRMASLEIAAGTKGDLLKQRVRAASKDLVNKSINNLLDVAEKESGFISKRIKNGTQLSKKDLMGKLLNENMRLNLGSQEKSRKSLQTAFNQFGRRKADEIVQVIRDGQALGLSKIEIMKNVDNLINGLQTRQARVLSHTATLYASNIAQRETLKQAHDKVKFTLGDSAEHTEICLGLEGKVFKTSEAPTPPLHWGCNSYLLPVDDKVPT